MDKMFCEYLLPANSAFGGILAEVEYDGHLSATAYIILTVVLLGIIVGLGWCFYKALIATEGAVEPQSPDEVGD